MYFHLFHQRSIRVVAIIGTLIPLTHLIFSIVNFANIELIINCLL